MTDKNLLSEQIDYYRARASEYDQWHLRKGRYDRGEEHRTKWFAELDAVRSALAGESPLGDCLELACGTGLWTVQLADLAAGVTAVDAAAETIEINRSKTAGHSITYEVADIFSWRPSHRYDFVFFGFWLSHVPEEKFDAFWGIVREAVKPDGRVFFVDGLKTQESTAKDHAMIDDSGIVERKLNSGQTFHIIKVFHEPEELQRRLARIGFQGRVESTGEFFYFGRVSPLSLPAQEP